MENETGLNFSELRTFVQIIYDNVARLNRVVQRYGICVMYLVNEKELTLKPELKSVIGLRIYAERIFNDEVLWQKLPETAIIQAGINKAFAWSKDAAKAELKKAIDILKTA